MVLSDLQAEVYALTKRPDKVDDTLRALRAALLTCHTMDFFSKDILETGVVFTALSTQQSFDYKSIIPLWRALSYIQPIDGTSFLPSGLPLEEYTPQNVFDEYAYYRENVYYQAGQVLQIRTYPGFQYFQIGYYTFPDVSASSQLQTWITQDYPYAVTYDAAARVFRSIGLLDQMKEMQEMAAEMRSLITTSNILATGE